MPRLALAKSWRHSIKDCTQFCVASDKEAPSSVLHTIADPYRQVNALFNKAFSKLFSWYAEQKRVKQALLVRYKKWSSCVDNPDEVPTKVIFTNSYFGWKLAFPVVSFQFKCDFCGQMKFFEFWQSKMESNHLLTLQTNRHITDTSILEIGKLKALQVRVRG